jgi:hypothetical protein
VFPCPTGAALAISLFGAGQALAEGCIDEVGADEAEMHVDQCLEVSPATHPPCNGANPCQMTEAAPCSATTRRSSAD